MRGEGVGRLVQYHRLSAQSLCRILKKVPDSPCLSPSFSYRRLRVGSKAVPRHILINLCLALFFLYLIFLVGIDLVSYRNGCIFVAFVLQYLTLACPLWIGVEVFSLYQSLVRGFDVRLCHFVPKATIIAWGKFT